VHFNAPVNYKELTSQYDYLVVATAKDIEAREMGLWEDHGMVHIRGAIVIGKFDASNINLYWDTDYTCHGYMRITPFGPTRAVLGFYNIGSPAEKVDELFERFLVREGLSNLEFIYKYKLPPFTLGKVTGFQKDNVLLSGRSAGMTDRLMGCGGIECILSGIMAARAIIKDLDYYALVKPLQDHIENISAFREQVNKLDNRGFDRLLTLLDTPGVKQFVYRSGINFIDTVGGILHKVQTGL
jgi:flavin-dependent dehydrogenase